MTDVDEGKDLNMHWAWIMSRQLDTMVNHCPDRDTALMRIDDKHTRTHTHAHIIIYLLTSLDNSGHNDY